MPLLVNVSYLRLSHYFLTFIFFAFVLFHVYASVLVSLEEENGLLDSIFSGWKFIPANGSAGRPRERPGGARFRPAPPTPSVRPAGGVARGRARRDGGPAQGR